MTNIKLITENIIDDLVESIQGASSIYILTSFVMESGVKLLEGPLNEAIQRGADVKLMAGDYLYVTQPEGLRRLIEIEPRMEVRLWQSKGVSFHPKAYMLQKDDGEGLLIVGSSNLSRSALVHGVEWNLAMPSAAEPITFQTALDLFMKTFYHEQTIPVNRETIGMYQREYDVFHQRFPQLAKNWSDREAQDLMYQGQSIQHKELAEGVKEAVASYSPFRPRPAQLEALEELDKTLQEGYRSAMVLMATGLGKTYLAGFFAQSFQRVLFVAHREEILLQAQRSFQHIMPDKSFGIFNGTRKEGEADGVFASIYTLAIQQHRESFAPDVFDLIVIDEFHHAAAPSYQRILDYFQPSFLLGITATPDRLDGKDVYALCDGNVAYQLHFIEAIQKGWLSPFHYYGIYDDTDYSQITWLGTRYDEEELMAVQLREEMAEKTYQAWTKHKQTKTLVFCSSICQADFLSDFFQQQGTSSLSLHSRTIELSRAEAIRQLERGSLEVIFTVDLFNEGVDIPSVDTLLFVRPTESLTIFTQQVGRGLRLHEGKEYCTIIDLIGNYRNADLKLSLFDMQTDLSDGASSRRGWVEPVVPDHCLWHADLEVINLLKELAKKKQPRKEKLREAFVELKQELGRRPSYLELHLQGKANSREYRQEFKSYVGFLHWAGELNDKEEEAFNRVEPWLREVESTGMAKSYKMVVLLYMLEKRTEHWMNPVTPEEVSPFFHHYLLEKEYRKRIDFSDTSSKKLWDYDQPKIAKLIADMPMTKWSGSSKGLVAFEGGVFQLNFDIVPEDREFVYGWTKEICLYRLHEHFERKGRALT